MNIKINPVHFKTDKRLESFISEKLQKMPSLFDGILSSEVMLKLENSETRENKIVEIRLIIRGNDLFAKKQSATFEEATDKAVEALRKQLLRHKDKLRNE